MEDYEYRNIKKLAEYFESGCKQESSKSMGLELEHFIVEKTGRKSVDYYGKGGVESILKCLSPYYEEEVIAKGHLIGLIGKEDVLTLEPGAQLEISISPQAEIQRVQEIYEKFDQRLQTALSEWNYESVTFGYRPVGKAEEIGMIPKERYQYMYRYFQSSGTCGKYMMKGTASTQVSIDYKNEEEFCLKYAVAYLLGPVFSLMTNYSPVFEGKPNEKRLLRQYIWEHVDGSRTAMPGGLLEPDFGFLKYAQYVYGMPQIVMVDEQGRFLSTKKSARELYAGKDLEEAEIEQILSMAFPDVRLKKYIEIRMADSMPFECALSFLALVKGIFMKEELLRGLLQDYGTSGCQGVEKAKASLEAEGGEAVIYGHPAAEIMERLFAMAEASLEEPERKYLLPLKKKCHLSP